MQQQNKNLHENAMQTQLTTCFQLNAKQMLLNIELDEAQTAQNHAEMSLDSHLSPIVATNLLQLVGLKADKLQVSLFSLVKLIKTKTR